MCAIAGLIHANPSERVMRSALEKMASRGPDATQVTKISNGLFGHNRLSIIDLSAKADQPMVSQNGNLTLVFNGEIYNHQDLRKELQDRGHQFQTQSDTESILIGFSEWGIVDLLKKLRGMFAFCIWDQKEKTATFARDHLGVKPFYYSQIGEQFYFASRPTAVRELMQKPVTVNRQALRYYFELGYVPAPFGIWNEIKKLQAGHFGIFKNNQIQIQKYWSDEKIRISEKFEVESLEQLLKQTEDRILESVRFRMVADVPVGVFLSGGIDSSLIAAAMKKIAPHQHIKSFNIGFDDPKFDESEDAAKIAKKIGTDHETKKISGDDLLLHLPNFIKNYDEPFYDYSALAVMAVSEQARKQVKVVLSGDGGDEAFGGYHYYQIINQLDLFYRLPLFFRKIFGFLIALLPFKTFRLVGNAMGQNSIEAAFAFMRGPFKLHGELLNSEFFSTTQSHLQLFEEKVKSFPAGLSSAERAMRLDSQLTLVDDYLQKVDVGTMAFSVEARDPFLDYKLVEFSRALPLKWKLGGWINGQNKFLLRKLAYKWLGQDLMDRPKKGFGLPMADWLRGPLKNFGEEKLKNIKIMSDMGLNSDKVLELWKQHQAGRDAHTALWSILSAIAFFEAHS